MPGKVNPVIPEMMMQVSTVIKDDSNNFCSCNGNFEPTQCCAVMAHNVLESIAIFQLVQKFW